MAEEAIISLVTRLDAWQRAKPDALAVIDYDIPQSRARGTLVRRAALTTRVLWKQILAMAAALRSQGVQRGDIVAVQLPNRHEFFVAHFALYAIGAVTSPIPPIYRKRDVARQLEVSRPVALIVPGSFGNFDYATMAIELKAEFDCIRFVLVNDGKVPAGALAWTDLLTLGASVGQASARAHFGSGAEAPGVDEMMLLNFTSGTTGQPKGVMHSTRSISSCIVYGTQRLQLGDRDVLLVAPTIGHGAGFLNGLYMAEHLQGCVVFMDAWDANFAIGIMERERVTYAPVMPTYLYDLVAQPAIRSADLKSWVTGRVSGGAISRTLMATLQEYLPQLRLCPGWGMSETLYSTCGSPDDPVDKRNFTEGNMVGDTQIEIRDATFDHVLPANTVGEIVTRGSSLFLGYYHQEDLTRAAFTADGWMKTGDLGRLDEQGYLTMVGRSKDLVIRGGENVPVVEVEQLLQEHELIAGAAVVGVPDARLGEKVCAVVELKQPGTSFTFEAMSAYLLEKRLTRHFLPEYLVVLDQLPRTPSGKIRKQDARAEALQRLQQ